MVDPLPFLFTPDSDRAVGLDGGEAFLERFSTNAPVGVEHSSFVGIQVSLGFDALGNPQAPVAWHSMPDLAPKMVQPALPRVQPVVETLEEIPGCLVSEWFNFRSNRTGVTWIVLSIGLKTSWKGASRLFWSSVCRCSS